MLDKAVKSSQRRNERTAIAATEGDPRSCGCFQGPWFVAEAVPGRIHLAEFALSADGWTVFCPMHVRRYASHHPDKIVPLFDPYLFIAIPAGRVWQRIVATPWVLRVLGDDQPRPVPDVFVDDLRARTSPRRVVDDPLVTPAAYPAGTPLVVTAGPLAGLAGICRLAAGDRVRLLLSLLGRDVTMDLAAANVMRAE